MTGRGRNFSQSNMWDSTRDDYNTSMYDLQYPDDDVSSRVNLDHCRLYIKNIPKALNDEGLRAAFAKFGTLVEVFLSKDPQKNYGLIRYETPGEAKLAMMKMNRTEPLRLQINIAHKSKKIVENRQSREWQDRNTSAGRDRNDRLSLSNRDRDESGSTVSRGRNSRVQEDLPNGDNMDDLLMEDDYAFSDILDPNLHLELESLKLEQLKVREEQLQCKQRVILLKQAERRPIAQMSNRCILPDGKIVVRNIHDSHSRDADVSYSAGAGDSLKLPGLQRVAARQCVVCSTAADLYCAGCGVTPYCTERCQRRDWADRHMAVCHNLARTVNENERGTRDLAEGDPKMVPAMPLRRPHLNTPNNKHEQQERNDDIPMSKASVKSSGSSTKGERFNKFQDKSRQNNDSANNTTKHDTPKNYHRNPRNNKTPQRQPAKEFEVKAENYQKTNNEHVQQVTTQKQKECIQKAAPPKQNLVPERSDPEPPIQKPEAPKSQETINPTPKESVNTPALIKPASVSDVTPTRKLIPKNYIIEKLAIGDAVIMSVEAKAADCRTNRGDYVCLTMAEAFETQYQSLCEDFVLDCDKDDQPYNLIPGETCSYFNPEDGGWYRARCLNPTTLALLDSGKIVAVSGTDKCRRLPNKYEAMPEFCAVLTNKTVEIGSNLSCKILSQTSDGYKISMTDVDTNANLGEGEVFRWVPTVEYQTASAAIPEVQRPPVTDGSKVLAVLAATLDRVFVRAADGDAQRTYNDVLQQVLLSAMNAQPLKEPPQKGQMVIGKFTDGNHYRALVKRTNVKQNKYQIEYIEYGNIEISTLENLYPCPSEVDLRSIPAQVSMVQLGTGELSPAAIEFIDTIKDEEELLLTLPEGRKSAPSGSESVLTMVKNKVNINNKLKEMCTPEWKKIEERGGDVLDSEHIMYDELVYSGLPLSGCTVEVLDISVLKGGLISGYDRTDPQASLIFNQLTEKMADYCNSELGREPYLPKPEELCIAQLPPYPQWFRAVYVGPVDGPGSKEGKVCYIDYGNFEEVPVSLLRKMLPEFITGYPAMGLHLEIKDFPEFPTDEMLARAVEHMQIDDEGRGTLRVTNCVKQANELYKVEAPDLLKAMQG